MSTIYPSDLSDAEWECLQPHLPALSRRGRPCTHPLRTILNAIFYLLRSGCPWRYLSSNFPPWQTVFYHFRGFRLQNHWYGVFTTLRTAERERVGRNPHPSAAIMDAQSVKTVEESAGISRYDAHKCEKRAQATSPGRYPRLAHLLQCDSRTCTTQKRARFLLAGRKYFLPRLKKIWADAAYRGKELADWCQAEGGWDLEVVERTPGVRGFTVLPKRWIVERTFGWLSRHRRLSKDYERKVQTSEILLKLAMIRLMVRRLARGPA
jgi:putative transposase